jgi:surface polysaccharide O-acyltransferase-like enzyme
MQTYLSYTGGLADATPDSRNRIVDFWRVIAIGFVVFGHWLAASIWLQSDGEIALLNSLEWIPYAAWITWLVQVMPVFFLAGGYANAKGLRRVIAGEQLRRDWITMRTRRLWTPVTPLLVVWVALIIALRPFIDSEVIFAGAMSATVPLWFLAVYITLTAAAPLTHLWWRRYGPLSVVGLVAIAVGIDVARFAFDVPGVGWVNFLFVWAAVHQIGYWWAQRDDEGGIPTGVGWGIGAAGLALLILVTAVEWYPVAMVGVPGAGLTNMTPPTTAIFLLGVVQAGVIWGTAARVKRFMARARAWHAIVALSGVIMTVYLWHLSAMSLVAAAGLNIFDGVIFKLEPGTTTWWLSRPLWIAGLALVASGLVAVFARFEWRVSDAPPPRSRRLVTLGVVLIAGSAAGVAMVGIADSNAVINWSIPGAAVVGAAILGALPRRKKR